MSAPTPDLYGADTGPWHVTVTRPATDPGDGRMVTTPHVVIASCADEAIDQALVQVTAATPGFNAAAAQTKARRICG